MVNSSTFDKAAIGSIVALVALIFYANISFGERIDTVLDIVTEFRLETQDSITGHKLELVDKFNSVDLRLNGVESGLNHLKTDVAVLKSDVEDLTTELDIVRNDVEELTQQGQTLIEFSERRDSPLLFITPLHKHPNYC